MAYCSHCGKQILQEARFCRYCGVITRKGKEYTHLEGRGTTPGPVPEVQLPTGLSEHTIQALGEELKVLMLADEVPFQREEIICLGTALEKEETLLEALSVRPDGLIVATCSRVIYIRKEAPELALTTTFIEDRSIESIRSQEFGNAIRVRLTVKESQDLSFVTTDKDLARNFIELIDYTTSLYAEDSSEDSDFESHYPVESSHAIEKHQQKDETQKRDESLEALKLILIAAWPLVVVYLKQKQASGEAPTILDIAAKVGIPSAAVTMLIPFLTEKLAEFLRDNNNISLLR